MTKGRGIESLVESQVKFHEIQKILAKGAPTQAVESFGPWLTISRQMGSMGSMLAARLAQPLGWRVYDREIITAIARETESSEMVIESRDGHATGKMDRYLSFFASSQDPGQAKYLHEMRQVIMHLAQEGRAIILGRGANWLLHEGRGIKLRLICPLEDRIDRVAKRREISLLEARELVRENDEAQRSFVRHAYGRDIEDPLGYDLILNMGELGLERAALLLVAALG